MMKFLPLIMLAGAASESHAWPEDDKEKKSGKQEKLTMKVPHIPAESRIVGGFDAEAEKYPFFVSWGGCGASLIAKDVILTAAHCQGVIQNTVRIGQYRKFGSVGQGLQRNIVKRVPHPDYSDFDVDYDYMVMKLDEAVVDDYVPIELNGNAFIPMDDQTLSVIGFGALAQQSQSTPSRLQQVDVSYIPTNTCNGSSKYNGDVKDDTMFCAGVEGGGKDSCQGDSGGPIFYERQDGSFEQVGIVSWGRGCALRNYPGVYSRISGELDWIQEQVCNISAFKPEYCGGENNSPISSQLPPPPPPTAQAPPQGTDCSDSSSEFYVDSNAGNRSCEWLRSNMGRYAYLCAFFDIAIKCQSLCDTCQYLQ